ncbi:MAG: phosphoribosyltransferase [Candidatus Hadarchaeales archaeon]
MEKHPEKHEAPSWEEIYLMCIELAEKIKSAGFDPDIIVAISRGGWVPGRIFSDLLGNPNIATIKVEHYLDIYKTLPSPQITQPLPIDVREKKILLVDDIADSGRSLKLVREHLFQQGAKDVKICALYYKPWSIVTPDFYGRSTDAWIWFPHEVFETMKKVYSRRVAEGKGVDEIKNEFLKIGLKEELIRKFFDWIGDSGASPSASEKN